MKNIIKLGLVSLLALPAVATAQEDDSTLRRVSKDIENLQSATQRVIDLNAQLSELDRRADPADRGVETLFGEAMPYSLPKKIAQYTEERGIRAAEINAQGSRINESLSKIKTLSSGKHDLSAYMTPTDVTPDAVGVARVEAFVDSGAIASLVGRLRDISKQAPDPDLDTNWEVGAKGENKAYVRHLPVELTNDSQIALLCLDASTSLEPSTSGASLTYSYSIARFLFADQVVKAAQEALHDALPKERALLQYRLDLERRIDAQKTEFHEKTQRLGELLNRNAESLEK